jgi:hypothetical protein
MELDLVRRELIWNPHFIPRLEERVAALEADHAARKIAHESAVTGPEDGPELAEDVDVILDPDEFADEFD